MKFNMSKDDKEKSGIEIFAKGKSHVKLGQTQ